MEPCDITSFDAVTFADAIALADSAGTPFDLTGYTATAHLYNGTPDQPGTVALSVSTANARLSLGTPTAGIITRTLSATVMNALLAGDYWWELVITNAGTGNVERLAWGFWQHKPTGI